MSTHRAHNPSPLPLDGVHVLDLTASVAGPFATQLLAELGADVVKVEHPMRGDDTRGWGPPFWDGESTMFLAMNAGKRSIGLDLRSAEGIDIARRLAARSDVVVQSMRPGLCEELGLGYDDVRAINPAVVYCTIGAYGARPPLGDQPGYDPLMQAAGGIMSVTGAPGSDPVRAGVSVVDQGTALWATIGVLAALRARDGDGHGRLVDTSLFETAVSWMGYHLVGYLASGSVPQPVGSRFAGIAPYEAFRASDGWLVVAAANDRLFAALCEVVGAPALALDARYATNRDRVANREALAEALQRRFETAGIAVWIERLTAAALPAAPVLDAAQVATHPQTAALEMIQHVPGHHIDDLRLVRTALSIDGDPVGPRGAPPALSEHAAAILAEIDVDSSDVDRLRRQGVVG